MESDSLDAEDYASVVQAGQLLSSRNRHSMTLNACTQQWAELVASVEEGINTMWADEFDNDIACRDRIHDVWPVLTERVARIRRPELDALDERFRAATAPMPGESSTARQERWWQYRYPLRVRGNPAERLPPAWSPAPRHLG
jgi:hypothetical protein